MGKKKIKIGIIGQQISGKAIAEALANKCDLHIVSGSTLIANDQQGTPIIDENGRKICNCRNPHPSLFPDGLFYCLECWGLYYH